MRGENSVLPVRHSRRATKFPKVNPLGCLALLAVAAFAQDPAAHPAGYTGSKSCAARPPAQAESHGKNRARPSVEQSARRKPRRPAH
jgi:hypothetical protein